MYNLKELWKSLRTIRKQQFLLLVVLMITASLLEVVSIGAVLPFLAAITAPEEVYQYPLVQPLIKFLEITRPDQIALPMTILFIIAALFAGLVRLLLLYVMTRLSFATGADLSIDIYQRTLCQGYAYHLERNSSEVISGIVTKTNIVINGVILPIINLISSIILIIGIMSLLFFINMKIALSLFVGFGFIYLLIVRYTRLHLKKNSQCIASQSTLVVKALQEGLGGIRDVLIDGTQKFYCQIYRNADLPLRRAMGDNQFITGSPRYVLEAIGIVLIATLSYVMSLQNDNISTFIPTLGVLALGAQKLLPSLQQVYRAYSSIKGSSASFEDILNLLNKRSSDCTNSREGLPVNFKNQISIENLNFRHNDEMPWVLKNINLKINKGSCIGIMGETGCGKSTLVDIIIGLLYPVNGRLTVDGKVINSQNSSSWQSHVAHVPQNIYLSDGTIEENIAFGTLKQQIDHDRVKLVAKQAQISDLVQKWEKGYQTIVGERGARLSGGQRQRIGIARALYKNSDVLIFDEATSALDSLTERAVMKAIRNLGKEVTIIIIAHRLTTLKECDSVVRFNSDHTISVGSYDNIVLLNDN